MGSPAIFAGKYTKLLTQKGIMNSDGSLNHFDGNKNYISYNNFENALTTGWSSFKTTMSAGFLPTGSIQAGDSNTVITTTTTNPLNGTRSLQWTFSASTLDGGYGFICDEFTIDREDLAKVLTFGFNYEITQGATNIEFGGTTGTQTLMVYIYDVTASAWLQPAGFLGMNQSSGSGTFKGTFQTSSTSGQKYRLAIFASEPTLNFSPDLIVKFDGFYVTKEVPTFGTPITDFQEYTPTISWTSGVSSTNGYWRRIGDSIECSMQINISGSVTAADLTVDIPSGLTIDATKLAGAIQGNTPVYGEAIGFDTSTSNRYVFRTQYWDSNSIRIIYQSSSTGQITAVTNQLPPIWASGDTISIRFVVPIVGFSSSLQMSNDTDTRVVAEIYYGNGGTSITGNTTNITFNTKDKSTHGAWSGTAFTAPISGFYQVFGSINITVGDTAQISIYINGTQKYRMFNNSSSTTTIKPFAGMVFLEAGDSMTLRSTGNATLSNTAAYHWISICRVSGASAIASSETVAAEYVSTAGNTLTNATGLFIDFPTKQADTHGAVLGAGSGNNATATSTWRYVAPISGRYMVNASITFASAATTNVEFISRIYVNGGVVQQGIRQSYTAWVASDLTIPATAELKLNAGDYVSIYVYQSSGANRAQATGTGTNRVSIIRVGN